MDFLTGQGLRNKNAFHFQTVFCSLNYAHNGLCPITARFKCMQVRLEVTGVRLKH